MNRRSRGAIALMTSLSMIVILGFTALTVDLGNAWQSRRNLVTATDASALAAAQEYAVNGVGCGTVSTSYITSNKADATVTACDPSQGALDGDPSGYVTVSAESNVTYAFAPIIGVDSGIVRSTTVARYGIPLTAGGLRPFGLCLVYLETLPEYIAWRASGNEASNLVEIRYSEDTNPSECNSQSPVPGNWATIDLDGGENSNADVQEWTLNGFPDNLIAHPNYAGDTGAFSPGVGAAMQSLMDSGEPFPIPVFRSAIGTGSNAVFDIVGFVAVKLFGFDITGQQANRSLTLKFVNATIEGQCCDDQGIDLGARVVQICAVSAADALDCEPSP